MTRVKSYGFKLTMSIENGIQDTIKWFIDNKDIIDLRFNAFKGDK